MITSSVPSFTSDEEHIILNNFAIGKEEVQYICVGIHIAQVRIETHRQHFNFN